MQSDLDFPLARPSKMQEFEGGIDDLMAELQGNPPPAKESGMTLQDIMAAMLEDSEYEPREPRPANADVFPQAAPVTVAGAMLPPSIRFRRIAAARSEHGRGGCLTERMERAVSKLSLHAPMPVPRCEAAVQELSPSPLGHEPIAVAAPPITRPVGSKTARRMQKECDNEIRKLQALSRAQQGKRPCTVRVLNDKWEEARFRACRYCLWLMTRNNGMKREFGGLFGTGLLEHSECTEAVRLLGCAARAAASHPYSHRLETASAPFWALVIVPEVCHRMRKDFVVTSDEAQRRFSFQGMAETFEEMKACVDGDRIPEPFIAFAAESLRPELDRTIGPMKYIGKHSLGSSAKVWKRKIACLDTLLRIAGERGLCRAVLDMRGPTQICLEKPVTAASTTRRAMLDRWGK